MSEFTPSSVPGCRVPHFWLKDGVSLFDKFEPGYTLLRADVSEDVSAIVKAAEQAGMPLNVLDITPDDEVAALYTAPLTMVRPDQHVAWRGHATDVDGAWLVDRLRGVLA